jgi:hypothetical protein
MKTKDKYILIGRDAVPCDDLLTWAQWFEHSNRVIKRETAGRWYEVSTIFLGIDMNIRSLITGDPTARPLLFESAIFSLNTDGSRRKLETFERCSTYDEAEQQHAGIVERLRRAEKS